MEEAEVYLSTRSGCIISHRTIQYTSIIGGGYLKFNSIVVIIQNEVASQPAALSCIYLSIYLSQGSSSTAMIVQDNDPSVRPITTTKTATIRNTRFPAISGPQDLAWYLCYRILCWTVTRSKIRTNSLRQDFQGETSLVSSCARHLDVMTACWKIAQSVESHAGDHDMYTDCVCNIVSIICLVSSITVASITSSSLCISNAGY